MSNGLRIFFVGGLISYRALFNWMRPAIYIPTMLIGPLFQILFFVYLGRYAGVRSDAFFLLGNGIQVSSMSCIFGAAMAIGNERYFATLGALTATPAPRLPLFLGRAVPFVASGLVVSAFGLVVGGAVLRYRPDAAAVPAIALVLVVSACACTAFGLALGSVAMRLRDVLLGANIAYVAMQLLCGVNVPLSALPGWLRTIGSGLPLTHGIEAARGLAGGESLARVGGLVWTEAAVGAAWAAAAYLLFRLFENEARRRATLETV